MFMEFFNLQSKELPNSFKGTKEEEEVKVKVTDIVKRKPISK